MNIIQAYEAAEIARLTEARAVPEFVPGDTLRVVRESRRRRARPRAGL